MRSENEVAILLLEDNQSDAELLRATFRSAGVDLNLKQVAAEVDFKAALQSWKPDVIVSDYSLPSYNGKEALLAAKELQPDTPFIFYSGTIGEEGAIAALKLGASDYILKEKPKRLIPAVQRAMDDAAQKRRQKAADERIRSLAHLLDLATDAIMVRNMENRILFWSKGAERLYGFTNEEAEGKLASQLLFKDSAADFEEAKRCTLRDGKWEGELEQITKSKQPVTVMSRWTLVRDSEGQRILAINTDVTERKQLQKDLFRAQRLESVGTLASGIAHDLNNILVPILMGCELLKDNQTSKEALETVSLVENSAKRGASIVKQLLTFVRGGDGKRVVVDLHLLLQEVCSMMRQTFPKNIKILCSTESGVARVKGDPTQLHQVFTNLCINSRDAMPKGGRIAISTKQMAESARVLIEVSDTGAGIPAELLDKVFDPFFTTKEPGKGTGLGLSVVMGIVKGHGGEVNVTSKPGEGTTVQISFPALAEKA